MLGLDPISLIAKSAGVIAKGVEVAGKGVALGAAKVTDKIVDGSAKRGIHTLKEAGKKGLEGIGKIGIKAGLHAGEEVKFQTDALSFMKKTLTGETPISGSMLGYSHPVTKALSKTALLKSNQDNLVGMKFTGLGGTFLLAGALGIGSAEAVDDYSKGRVGYNDGNIRSHAPAMNSQTFSSMGQSYNDNAGATGDLGFALHNQRNTGYL